MLYCILQVVFSMESHVAFNLEYFPPPPFFKGRNGRTRQDEFKFLKVDWGGGIAFHP